MCAVAFALLLCLGLTLAVSLQGARQEEEDHGSEKPGIGSNSDSSGSENEESGGKSKEQFASLHQWNF